MYINTHTYICGLYDIYYGDVILVLSLQWKTVQLHFINIVPIPNCFEEVIIDNLDHVCTLDL